MDAVPAIGNAIQPKRWRLRLPERLPDLKGNWLTFYTIVWSIMLPIALIGAARGTYILTTTPAMWGPYGFVTSEDNSGLHVDAVSSTAASEAGLRAGDYIIAVDSWGVPRTAGRSAARAHVVKPYGAVATFTIRRPNGERYQAQLIRSVATQEEIFRRAGVTWTFARSLNFVGILLLPTLFMSAAILLFVRRRREAVPALLSLSFLMFGSTLNAGDLIGVSVDVINGIRMIGTFLLYAALFAFPSGRFEPRWTAIPFLLLFPAMLIDGKEPIGTIMGISFSLLCLVGLISRYRNVGPGLERLQLRWAFLGLVAGVFLAMLWLAGDAAVTAWQAEDPRWAAWGYVFVQTLGIWGLGVMALGLIVSILRYRLYDADAVIGRSAAYGMLTLGFVVLFAGSQKIIELMGQQYFGQNLGALAGGIGAAIAAVAIAPMHARAQRWAERRFQKALYRLRCGLPPLVGDLRETSGIREIAGATLDSLVDGVRTCRAALISGEELIDAREISAIDVEEWRSGWKRPIRDGIDLDKSDALFPVRVPLEAEGHGRVGWILLGPRPDGSLFGKAERAAIEEIAEPVARAVQVATSREEREARFERRFAVLEKRIADLQVRPRPPTP